jgi:hypothetical protein
MRELAHDIRTYIDNAALPVTLEEARSRHHQDGGTSIQPAPWRPTATRVVTATVVVVVVLTGAGLLVALGPRSSNSGTTPSNSALAPSHRPLMTARQAIAMEVPSVEHVTRAAAKLTTYGQVLAAAEPQSSFPNLGPDALSARVWVVAIAGTVNPNSTTALIPEHYTWEAVFINQQTRKAVGSVDGSTGDWPPFFNALPGRSHVYAKPHPGATTLPGSGPILLGGDGIGSAVFGQTESMAIANLEKVLGAPLSTEPTLSNNCTIDAYLRWSTMTFYFDHQRFVGYATGSLIGGPGYRDIPNVITAGGLRIGDTLAQAQRIYGAALRTSPAQGGSWFAATPTGTLAGLFTTEVNETTPTPRIADITAGSVGCPAVSP